MYLFEQLICGFCVQSYEENPLKTLSKELGKSLCAHPSKGEETLLA
jgi:hypothetical protein